VGVWLVLVDSGFEQSELVEPRRALQGEGATADIVSPQSSKVKGWHHTNWGASSPRR
jgi:protease I